MTRRTLRVGCGLVLTLLLVVPWNGVQAQGKGFVDSSAFVELAGGDDSVMFEVNFGGALLRAVSRVDPHLHEMVAGVDRIHAVILELGENGSHARAKDVISDTGKKLLRMGWERIARVREADGDVQVLVMNDEETIQGLVVMVVSLSDNELIFANIAGDIDLAKIQAIGEQMEIPGLEDLELE